MNNNLLNDHQIITELIGNAAQLPAEDPRAARCRPDDCPWVNG